MVSEYRYKEDSELIESYDTCGEYILERDTEICRRAGMSEQWETADGETFEAILAKAVEILREDV